MSKAKQKGTSFETLIKDYLIGEGFIHAHRPALSGVNDTGDINGVANSSGRKVAFQCKNHKQFALSSWLNDTVEQAARLDNAVPALVVKRSGKGKAAVGDTYAVMRLSDLVDLLKAAGYY